MFGKCRPVAFTTQVVPWERARSVNRRKARLFQKWPEQSVRDSFSGWGELAVSHPVDEEKGTRSDPMSVHHSSLVSA